MGTLLVLLERRSGEVKAAGLQAVSTARRLAAAGETVAALALGSGAGSAAAAAGEAGADRLYAVDEALYDAYAPETYVAALAAAVEASSASIVLAPGTAMGRDVLARASARLSAGLLTDVVELERTDAGGLRGNRPVYSGKAYARVRVDGPGVAMATLRPNTFSQSSEAGRVADVAALTVTAVTPRASVARTEKPAEQEIDVAEAPIVVSGGRGLKAPENFKLIRDLAAALGGAVGASRAVVDAGWIDHSHQVGQTGKVVSPSLYVACGISGAIQHLAGMSTSKVIVAINKDPEAPIFKAATYGIVADLFEVVPKLTEDVRRLKAN